MKKLTLKKVTLSNLNRREQDEVVGGYATIASCLPTFCFGCTLGEDCGTAGCPPSQYCSNGCTNMGHTCVNPAACAGGPTDDSAVPAATCNP